MGWDALIESITLPEPNIASENRPFQKKRIFQPSIYSGANC